MTLIITDSIGRTYNEEQIAAIRDFIENKNAELSEALFQWKELDGKKLKISVSQDVDNKAKEMTTVVIGHEKKTGNMYTLHMETKRI